MKLWQLQIVLIALFAALLLGFAALPSLLKPASLRQACAELVPDGTVRDRGRAICRGE